MTRPADLGAASDRGHALPPEQSANRFPESSHAPQSARPSPTSCRFTALEGAVTTRLGIMQRRFSVQEERVSAMLAVIVRMAERLDQTPEPHPGKAAPPPASAASLPSSSKPLKAAKNRGIPNAAMSLRSCVGRTQSQPIVMRCRGSNSCLAAAKVVECAVARLDRNTLRSGRVSKSIRLARGATRADVIMTEVDVVIVTLRSARRAQMRGS